MAADLSQAKLLLRRAVAEAAHSSGVTDQIALRSSPPWRVLMYHRITTPEAAGYSLQPGMYVRPKTFERHAAFLSKNYNVVPLQELVEKVTGGERIASRTVALTFDDGWLDNYTNAFPLLKKHKLPATIFLATALIGTNETLWTDKVARALCALRERGEVVRFSEEIRDHENMPSLVVSPVNRLVDRASGGLLQRAVGEVISALQSLDAEERNTAAGALLKLAERHVALEPERSFVSWDEAREMAADSISFGSHTDSHRKLTELTDEEIEQELQLSLDRLRSHELKPCGVFCYPEGAWSERTQKVLARNGWKYALAAGKKGDLSQSPRLLPRVGIHDDIAQTAGMLAFRTWIY